MPESSIRSISRRLRHPGALAAAAAALLAVGGGAGAVAMQATRPSVTMAPATPVAIRAMSSDSVVTIKGRVAEVFGNKFILADTSGRALVDTGREGESGTLVTVGQTVMVQGRFDRGFVRAAFLVDAADKVVALGPLGRPHGGPERHARARQVAAEAPRPAAGDAPRGEAQSGPAARYPVSQPPPQTPVN